MELMSGMNPFLAKVAELESRNEAYLSQKTKMGLVKSMML